MERVIVIYDVVEGLLDKEKREEKREREEEWEMDA